MKERLDKLLARRGLASSRARAADAIRRGAVRVDGRPVRKPGTLVAADARVEVHDAARSLVSRAALKLRAAFAAVPALGEAAMEAACLDVGASTGGFVQVLLEQGARRVFAVDVGHGQLHERLRRDARVVVLEGVNARVLDASLIDEPVAVITADVSFISLTKALPAALTLAAPDAMLAALVKPQFEVGPDRVGKGGIVRNEALRRRALEEVADWVEERGWRVARALPSPITGGDGNAEWLLVARKAP